MNEGDRERRVALTADERNAVIDGIIRVLHTKRALDLFEDPASRRLLADYVEIADELGFDEPIRETYPVERSLPALRRVLTEWRDAAETWLKHDDMYRLEQWTRCQGLLRRLGEAET
jgi:hypothetical protein